MQAVCHICGTECSRSDALQCSNESQRLANGASVCTKWVCKGCFDAHGWDWRAAITDSRWECTHCRGVCPRCELAPSLGRPGAGPLDDQLRQARAAASYLACLKAIGDAQPPAGDPAETLPSAFVDRLASFMTPDTSEPPERRGQGPGPRGQGGSTHGRSMSAHPPPPPAHALRARPPARWPARDGRDGGRLNVATANAAAASAHAYAAARAPLHGTAAFEEAQPFRGDGFRGDGFRGDGFRGDGFLGEPGANGPFLPAPAAAHCWQGGEHSPSGADSRLACWGSPAVGGDAWGHEGAAGGAVSVRTGSGVSIEAHQVIVLVHGHVHGHVHAHVRVHLSRLRRIR